MMLSSSAVDGLLGIQTGNHGETNRPWTPGVRPPRSRPWSATRRAGRGVRHADPQVLTITPAPLVDGDVTDDEISPFVGGLSQLLRGDSAGVATGERGDE